MDKSTDKQPLTPELEARVQRAVDNFMQGYGCCQSVVAAFADFTTSTTRWRSVLRQASVAE